MKTFIIKVNAIIKINGFNAFNIIINGIFDKNIIIILIKKITDKVYISEAKKIAVI
jgi:hypothetical protein